jgi:hypothetical protein
MITVKYSCDLCGADKISVTVPERKHDEDVADFVQETARLVGIHHSHRNCAGKTCDLMIPFNDEIVGREPR